MGFDIGKPFSDNALSLLERRREADQQNALELAKLGLGASASARAERAQNRALAVQEMRGQQESDRLSRTQDFEEKKYGAESDLRRALASANHELGYAQLGETARHHGSQEETDASRAKDMEGYHSGLLDLGEVNALSGQSRADSEARRATEDEAMGAYNRGPLGESKIAANNALGGLRGAQTGEATARTELTKEKALELRNTYGLRTGVDFYKAITHLINSYNAAAGNPNGPNKQAMSDAAAGIASLKSIAQLTGVDVGSLDQHMRAMGTKTPFGQATAGAFTPAQGLGNGTPSDAKSALARYLGGGQEAAPAPQEAPQALGQRGPPDRVETAPDGSVWAWWGNHAEMIPRGQPIPGKPPPTTGR
jgi:hypothetical protein